MAEPRNGRGSGSRMPDASRNPSGQAGGWLRGIHFSGFSIVMMALLVLAVVVLAPALHEYVQQRQQITDARQTVSDLKSQISKMDQERARWSDPSYIRAQARERLYYVMPGDISYLIIDDRPASEKNAKQAPVSTKIQSTPSDWSASLFGSFMTAGLTDETPAQLSKDSGGAPTSTPSPSTTPGPDTTPTPSTAPTTGR